MEPATFEHQNKTLARPQDMSEEECGPLPVYSDGKMCISSWDLSLKERISALIFGKAWLWVYSGSTQPPVSIEATRTIFGKSL